MGREPHTLASSLACWPGVWRLGLWEPTPDAPGVGLHCVHWGPPKGGPWEHGPHPSLDLGQALDGSTMPWVHGIPWHSHHGGGCSGYHGPVALTCCTCCTCGTPPLMVLPHPPCLWTMWHHGCKACTFDTCLKPAWSLDMHVGGGGALLWL